MENNVALIGPACGPQNANHIWSATFEVPLLSKPPSKPYSTTARQQDARTIQGPRLLPHAPALSPSRPQRLRSPALLRGHHQPPQVRGSYQESCRMVRRSTSTTQQDPDNARRRRNNRQYPDIFTTVLYANVVKATLSLLASATLILLPKDSISPWTRSCVSPTMLVLVIGARRYIKGFWAPSTDSKGKDQGSRIPLPKMGDYNLAVQKTEDLLKCLEYMEYSWVRGA